TNELFLAGTEPRDDSADYFASDGKLLLPDAYTRWCASRDNTIGAHVQSDFRITSPPPNARYQIDPVLAPSQQMVELSAGCGREVEWFVNGARVAPERDGRFFWQLAAGEWNVRAISGGKLAEEKIIVEDITGADLDVSINMALRASRRLSGQVFLWFCLDFAQRISKTFCTSGSSNDHERHGNTMRGNRRVAGLRGSSRCRAG